MVIVKDILSLNKKQSLECRYRELSYILSISNVTTLTFFFFMKYLE